MSAGENGTGSDSHRRWSPKSTWNRLPLPLRRLLKGGFILSIGAIVLAILLSFPFVRAAGYPIFGAFADDSIYVNEYCPVYTSDEKPSLLVRSSRYLFYDLKAFRQTPTSPKDAFPLKRDQQPTNVPELFNMSASYSAQGFLTPRDFHTAHSRIELPVLPRGDYLAIIKATSMFPGHTATKWIRFKVTDLGAVIKRDPDKILVSTFDLRTRKPWTNASVRAIHDGSNELTVQTNAQGVAEIKRPGPETSWTSFTIDIKSGDNSAYLGNYENQYDMHHHTDGYQDLLGYFSNFDRHYRTFFTTDRPIYRLGQTIQIRALTRLQTPSGITNPGAGVETNVHIHDQNGKTIKETKMKTDTFGGISIKLNPGDYSATGQYQVQLAFANEQTQQFTFQVDQYRKPEFKLDVVPEKDRFVRGEQIKVRIKANYYFGAPVANTKVKYRISSYADDSAKSRLNQTPGTTTFFDNWQDSSNYYPYSGFRTTNQQAEVTTDDAGEALITIDTNKTEPATANPYSYQYFDESYNISVEATDLSRKTVTSEGSAALARGEFAVFVNPRSSVVKVGEKLEVGLSAFDYQRTPVASQDLSVKLVRWKMNDPQKGTYEAVPVAQSKATTDSAGKTTATFTIEDKSPSDQYYVTAETKDKSGHTVGSVAYVWVIGDKTDSWISQDKDRQFLKVNLDKPSYMPGQTARVVVSAPVTNDEENYLLVALEGSRLHSYKIVNMKGPAALVEFPVEDRFVPNAYVTACLVGKNHHPYKTSTMLKVAPDKHFLKCTISSDKPQYHPGDTVKYTIKAHEPDGKPAANVQLCASVVDEGLYAIYENLKRQMYFYEYGKIDIFNAIFQQVDNEVETRFTFTDSYSAVVPETAVFDGGGLLLLLSPILDFGAGTPFHVRDNYYKRFPFAQNAMRQDMEGAMADCCCETCAAKAPGAAPSPTRAAKQGGNAGPKRGSAAPQPRVRSNFLDSVGFFPTLLTNAAGEASFSVKLPDDLTTWRTSVNGISTQTQVGSTQGSTISTQDFLARLALPRFYTEGDETTVSGLIHNLSGKTQSVRASVATSANLLLNEPAEKQVTLVKDEVKRVSWRVTVGKAGPGEVTIKAIGGTTADAEKRSLPINPFGYRIYFSKNGVLKKPTDSANFPLIIPQDAKLDDGQLALSLSSSAIGPVLGNFEKLIEYPYGCTEQTLSKLIPSVVSMRLSKELNIEVTSEVKLKQLEVYNLAMPKLIDYHHSDGGWGWWKEDQSNPYMTAHVLEGFYLLRKAGFAIDEYTIDSGLTFLQTQISALSGNSWNLDPSVDQAKSVYVLSLFDRSPNSAEKLWQMANLSKAPPEALAYLAIAFKNRGDDVAATQAYKRLKSLANESLEYTSWDHTKAMLEKLGYKNSWDYTYRFSGVETTALALRAVAVMEPKNSELMESITRWLILQRDEDGWGNTKSTSAVFLALLEKELANQPDRTTNYRARVDAASTLIKEIAFNKTFERREERVIVPLAARPPHVTLSKNGSGWLYYSSLLEYDRPLKTGEQPLLKSMPADLKVKEDFFRLVAPPQATANGTGTATGAPTGAAKGTAQSSLPGSGVTTYKLAELGVAPLKPGDIIMMRVVVDSPFTIPYAMVEAALPSGGEVLRTPPPVDQKLPGEKADKVGSSEESNWYWWTHQDILDDRIAFFSGNMPSGKSEFRAFIRVEMPGKFNINPVTMEAMYTDKVHARSTAHTINVKE